MNELMLRPFGLMDDLFEDFPFNSRAKIYEPRVNISETDDKCSLEIEMAGVDKKDMDIQIENGYLNVNVNKKDEKEENKKNYIKREISSYNYSKSFKLTDNLDTNKIKAESKDGILTIDIPKVARKKPKLIKVT